MEGRQIPQTPSTIGQIGLLVLFVLPGVSYQFARERFRGPSPRQRDLAERVLLAVAASIILDTIYVAVFGRTLINLIFKKKEGWIPASDPRPAAVFALILLFAVPAFLAWAISWREGRQRKSFYDSTPPWRHAVGDRDPCFIRARTKGGNWVGGWFGNNSNIALSGPIDLFLESAWEMSYDGRFMQRVDDSSGLYLRLDELEYIEFIDPSTTDKAGKS
ncbi:DUF6338 family protein [Actinoallomurus sp. CA-142502]|uniref:DUF6338 family protein n=1 Tax=Actinoallomurus sp. CA-142502 TaxID=3239885 RepID=UPI003D90E39F